MKTIISMTLLHSLWQGLILAVITGLILVLTQKAPAKTQYRYLTAALALFTLSMAATLAMLISKAFHANSTVMATIQLSDNNGRGRLGPGVIDPAGLLRYLTSHATYIFWAWLLIMGAKCFRMGYGMYTVHRLKHVGVYDAGQYWVEKVSAICERLRIHRKVRILQSGLAEVPVVIGHLKPVILMPLGLINRLTVAEVEAIISHELAHILRKDYLVNLLQAFLETIFFFNPAVLWLNGLIRQKREHCCDDLALQVNAGVRDYISALVGCYEYRPRINRFAMAFPSAKNQLLKRVARIAGSTSRGTIRPVKAAVILVLLTAGIAVAALWAQGESGGRMVTTSISIEDHQEIKGISEVLAGQNHPLAADISRQKADSLTAKADSITAEADALTAIADASVAKADSAASVADRQAATGSGLQGTLQDGFTETDGAHMHRALYEDGIIHDLKNTSYTLNNDALIVNDVKQPEATRQKYAAQYLKSPGKSISYDYHLRD